MRRKKLLTAALCTVLILASCTVSSAFNNGTQTTRQNPSSAAAYTSDEEMLQLSGQTADTVTLLEEGTVSQDQDTSSNEKKTNNDVNLTSDNSQETPQTDPPQTDPPQTDPPQTNPPQTDPPQTNPPQTDPPQTNPPQTDPPQTNPPQTDPPQTNPPQTEGQTQAPSEPSTQPSTEGQTQSPSEPSTQPSTEGQTQVPSETTPGTEQLPSETTPGTEQLPSEMTPDTGDQTEAMTGPGETAVTERETRKEKKETETETETEEESETSLYGSNEELIAHQNIVRPPDIVLEFRFTKIEKNYGIVQDREGAQIYESKSTDARAVGSLPYYGVCCILEDAGDGWYYVESRNVRGFMAAEQLAIGDVAQRIVDVKGLDELPEARLLVARSENKAFDYTHTTTQEVMAEKQYAIAREETVNIYEQHNTSARVTGTLSEGALCYILADEDRDWIFVESGNARGFVQKEELLTGKKAEKEVSEKGENNMPLADVEIQPEDNSACYYTLTSVREASKSAKLREDIVNFALQFLGNPYVWGGTSLTNGADCSGFVQSVYANFGYYLPRVAEAQSVYGMQIPIDSAEPGDLIFYARNGYVYHVSMYIGNGQVVHAAGRKVGIITSGISGNAVWATRIITD